MATADSPVNHSGSWTFRLLVSTTKRAVVRAHRSRRHSPPRRLACRLLLHTREPQERAVCPHRRLASSPGAALQLARRLCAVLSQHPVNNAPGQEAAGAQEGRLQDWRQAVPEGEHLVRRLQLMTVAAGGWQGGPSKQTRWRAHELSASALSEPPELGTQSAGAPLQAWRA